MEVFSSISALLYEAVQPLSLGAAGLGILVGAIAALSPRRFEGLCEVSNRWIKTPLQLSKIDARIADPEALARRHVRVTGLLILTLALTLIVMVCRF